MVYIKLTKGTNSTLKEFIMALHSHTPKQRKEIKSQAKKSSTPAKKANKAAKK